MYQTPDAIAERALIEMSRLQRESLAYDYAQDFNYLENMHMMLSKIERRAIRYDVRMRKLVSGQPHALTVRNMHIYTNAAQARMCGVKALCDAGDRVAARKVIELRKAYGASYRRHLHDIGFRLPA